tara:strand:+ start:119 stop:466 length:348 start_codon:yes stop_codon:yes gene_type:complete
MIVAPVVVHPETDSNNASTKLKDKSLSKIKGILPKILSTTQNKTTIKNPSFDLMSDDFIFWFGKKRIDPIMINTVNDKMKVKIFPSEKNIEAIIGIRRVPENIISIMPIILFIIG